MEHKAVISKREPLGYRAVADRTWGIPRLKSDRKKSMILFSSSSRTSVTSINARAAGCTDVFAVVAMPAQVFYLCNPSFDVEGERIGHEMIGGRWYAELLTQRCHLSAQPGQLQPIAALQVSEHRGGHAPLAVLKPLEVAYPWRRLPGRGNFSSAAASIRSGSTCAAATCC